MKSTIYEVRFAMGNARFFLRQSYCCCTHSIERNWRLLRLARVLSREPDIEAGGYCTAKLQTVFEPVAAYTPK